MPASPILTGLVHLALGLSAAGYALAFAARTACSTARSAGPSHAASVTAFAIAGAVAILAADSLRSVLALGLVGLALTLAGGAGARPDLHAPVAGAALIAALASAALALVPASNA